jgi:sporulation protein YlmC with PRC-barrel domain
MLRSIDKIFGYSIKAKDGLIGAVYDFLVDDEQWVIRYLVAETGKWLKKKKVLISPAAFFGKPEWESKTFPVILTKKMVENSPDIDTDRPVSRQKEMEVLEYYRWPIYWYPQAMFPTGPPPIKNKKKRDVDSGDIHLRSAREIIEYQIQASNGEIGHVEDFVLDDESWNIRYMVVDTRNWLPGRKVIISPQWIEKISWVESKVHVGLALEIIEKSPEYDPSAPVNREYEEVLYDYYGRPKYWQ